MPEVTFTPLTPADVLTIEVQPSQGRPLGVDYAPGEAEIARMCGGVVALAARSEGRLLACFGIVEQFAGVHGTGWAMLAQGIGGAHLAITRRARAELEACQLARVELIARCENVEGLLERRPGLDGAMVAMLAQSVATPEIRWGLALGFTAAHVLRCYGADGASVMLMERIRPALLVPELREAA